MTNKVLKKYYVWPIGCAQNISDAERVAAVLETLGYTFTSDEKEADVVCALACSVKQTAIDRIHGRAKNWRTYDKQPLKILSGCVLPQDKVKMEKIFDIVFNINELTGLPKLISDTIGKNPKHEYQPARNEFHSGGNTKQAPNSKVQKIRQEISDLNNSDLIRVSKFDIRNSSKDYFNYLSIKPKHKNNFQALVPIINGCNNFCSYCAVPYARGREVSRPMEEIVSEVKELVANGYKEIMLLGQNVNSYQNSLSDTDLERIDTEAITDFHQLLIKLNEIPGDFWIRYYSSHPKDFSDKLIEDLPNLKKVTPCIHLPVQSGSDKILKLMNRKYSREQYLKLVNKIKSAIPNVSLSTDTIVGFPTETEDDFQDTISLYEKVGFDMAYISKYSPRSGTVSAKMIDDVEKAEKERRLKVLTAVLAKTALENNQKYIGQTEKVLIEKVYKSEPWGRTASYKNIKITQEGETLLNKNKTKSPDELIGTFVEVEILDATPWVLSGQATT